jgi:hypothetical protein
MFYNYYKFTTKKAYFIHQRSKIEHCTLNNVRIRKQLKTHNE